jgi:hypothetical protein
MHSLAASATEKAPRVVSGGLNRWAGPGIPNFGLPMITHLDKPHHSSGRLPTGYRWPIQSNGSAVIAAMLAIGTVAAMLSRPF